MFSSFYLILCKDIIEKTFTLHVCDSLRIFRDTQFGRREGPTKITSIKRFAEVGHREGWREEEGEDEEEEDGEGMRGRQGHVVVYIGTKNHHSRSQLFIA